MRYPFDSIPESFPPDTMLGRYKIVRRLGISGMDEVYEALHTDVNKRVAIKTLLPVAATKPGIDEDYPYGLVHWVRWSKRPIRIIRCERRTCTQS